MIYFAYLVAVVAYIFMLILCGCIGYHYYQTDYNIDKRCVRCIKIFFFIFLIIIIALFPILIKL